MRACVRWVECWPLQLYALVPLLLSEVSELELGCLPSQAPPRLCGLAPMELACPHHSWPPRRDPPQAQAPLCTGASLLPGHVCGGGLPKLRKALALLKLSTQRAAPSCVRAPEMFPVVASAC